MTSTMPLRNLILLVFLTASTQESIKVDVIASDNENECHVNLSGTNVNIISSEETKSFHLDDSSLKEAVNAYFGSKPTDAFLKSPTPWGDLYRLYGWPEVSRILKLVKARILGVQIESIIVLTRTFNNTSNKNDTLKAKIQKGVENTVSSKWSSEGNLNSNLTIGYHFGIIGSALVSGKTSFGYTSTWGKDVEKTEKVTVGPESGVDIKLNPNESVVVELQAKHVIINIEVDYEASLSGQTAVNYLNGYKGHHYWGLNITSVMTAGHLNPKLKSTETIRLGYFSESKVIINGPHGPQ